MSNHYMETYWNSLRITGVIIHDLVAVMLSINPCLSSQEDIYKKVNAQMECEGICRGQTVVQLNPIDSIEDMEPKNANVYMGINNTAFRDSFF